MLQTIGNAQTRRAYALISALDAKEITLDEFADALRAMPAEVLQVSGTMLALMGVNEPEEPQICRARLLCQRLSNISRPLN
jgi:hypothetical protein